MLKTMANRVARSHNNTGDQEEVFFDPASIVVYATIIIEIVKLVKRCREAKSIPNTAQQPTRREKAVNKRVVRKKLGFVRNFREGKSIVNSVFAVGAGSTEQEMEELYKEV